MPEVTRFDCPRCRREYQLAIPADTLLQSSKRALCTRCGERFEIRGRLQALADEDEYEVLISVPADEDPGVIEAPPAIAEAIEAAVPAQLEPPVAAGEAIAAEALEADEPEALVPEGEAPEALVPPPLDWLAYAGADAAASGHEPPAREAELRALLDGR